MESNITYLTTAFELGEEKALKIMERLSESEDSSKTNFSLSRLFQYGVLPENTRGFIHLLLEERFPGKGIEFGLNREELQQLLSDAFANTYRYLLTPQLFISEFLSEESDAVHINVKMLARLRSFTDYPYFPDMLEEWLQTTAQNLAPKERKRSLEKFLYEIESAIMKYATPDEVAMYLQPLYDFHPAESLPRSEVERLLADKGLTFPEENEEKNFTASDLSALIKEAYISHELKYPAEIHTPIPQYETFLEELREIGIILPAPHPQSLNGEMKNIPPLEMFISSKLRKKCLEKIFHENQAEYDQSIEMLNAIGDYAQSELNLNTLLHIHKISPHSKVATRLRESLRLRFGINTQIESPE